MLVMATGGDGGRSALWRWRWRLDGGRGRGYAMTRRRDKTRRLDVGSGGSGGRRAEEDGGGVVRDGEGFAGGEGDQCGTGDAKGATVIGVRGGEVVAGINGLLHETTPFLAPPHRVLVVELRRRASHSYFTSVGVNNNKK